MNILILADESAKACDSYRILMKNHINPLPEDADVIVTLGGDGFLLKCLSRYNRFRKPFYGINRGTFGFLLNRWSEQDDLLGVIDNIKSSDSYTLRPLRIKAVDSKGNVSIFYAFNDVHIMRTTALALSLRVAVDNVVRIEKLVADGCVIATPSGSTAYNFSCGGPILPLDINAIVFTPISCFRPRGWRGALLNNDNVVKITSNSKERKFGVFADNYNIGYDIEEIIVNQAPREDNVEILFHRSMGLNERIMKEQFFAGDELF